MGPILIQYTKYYATSTYIFERGIVPDARTICMIVMTVQICADRICLGQQTSVCHGDILLIMLQDKPWTWVSTMFIFVCIRLSAVST